MRRRHVRFHVALLLENLTAHRAYESSLLLAFVFEMAQQASPMQVQVRTLWTVVTEFLRSHCKKYGTFGNNM